MKSNDDDSEETRVAQAPPPEAALPPMRFTYATGDRPLDGYTVKRGIGCGGFGEVYYATSDGGKEVALKRVQRHFDVELRGVGQCLNLKHPNLVGLHDVKQSADGDRWVIMEYVAGETLVDAIARHPHGMPSHELLANLRGICAGVGYLHDQGIVHRDLKPSNIFVENGQVKIGDYGLAKFISVSRRSGQTESVGTVHYMAPELSTGRYGKEIDLYAVGVMLYEMVTGRVPFDGESPGEILMKHLTGEPDLSPLPLPYRAVVGRLLAKDPAERYPSVDAMLADLDRCLGGGAAGDVVVEAEKRPTERYRAQPGRVPKRRPLDLGRCFNDALEVYQRNFIVLVIAAMLLVVLSAVSLLILCGPLSGGMALLTLAALRRQDKTVELGDLFGSFDQFGRLVGLFFLTSLLVLAGLCLGVVPGVVLATLWMYPVYLVVDKRLGVFPALGASSRMVVRNGFWLNLLLCVIAFLLEAVPSLIPVVGLVLPWLVTPIAWLMVASAYLQQIPEGITVERPASDGEAGAFANWLSRLGAVLLRLPVALFFGAGVGLFVTGIALGLTGEQADVAAFAACGAGFLTGGLVLTLLCRSLEGPHRWWPVLAALFFGAGTGLSVAAICAATGLREEFTAFAGSGSGFFTAGLVSVLLFALLGVRAGWRGIIIAMFLAAGTGLLVASVGVAMEADEAVTAFVSVGGGFLTAGMLVYLVIFAAAAKRRNDRLAGKAGVPGEPATPFGPTGNWSDAAAHAKDRPRGITHLQALKLAIISFGVVTLVLLGAMAAFRTRQRTTVWMNGDFPAAVKPQLTVEWELHRFTNHSGGQVRSIAFNSDGTRLASGGADALVQLYDMSTNTQIRSMTGHTAAVTQVAFSPDGMRLAAAAECLDVRVWDVGTGEELSKSIDHPGYVHTVAFSRDGGQLATGSTDDVVRLLDATNGQQVRQFFGSKQQVHSVAFSPDGTSLAAADVFGGVRMWEAASGRHIRSFGADRWVDCITFSHDGRRLAVASRYRDVELWDVDLPEAIRQLPGTQSRAIAFGPDGSQLAVAGWEGVQLWDLDLGEPVCRFVGHRGEVACVAFHPDGSRLASGGSDGTLRIWEIPKTVRKAPPVVLETPAATPGDAPQTEQDEPEVEPRDAPQTEQAEPETERGDASQPEQAEPETEPGDAPQPEQAEPEAAARPGG